MIIIESGTPEWSDAQPRLRIRKWVKAKLTQLFRWSCVKSAGQGLTMDMQQESSRLLGSKNPHNINTGKQNSQNPQHRKSPTKR